MSKIMNGKSKGQDQYPRILSPTDLIKNKTKQQQKTKQKGCFPAVTKNNKQQKRQEYIEVYSGIDSLQKEVFIQG